MPAAASIPPSLCAAPFTAGTAHCLGVSEKVLRGRRFHRLFPRVWVHVDHVMSRLDWIDAARLAAPARAQLSHLTRIQALGLDFGPEVPYHFTVAGDLHIALDDIYVHRTAVLPPLDDVGVTPAAAFIQYCATGRLIDAIKVGDWLLHHRHMTRLEVSELTRRDDWRPGAYEARRVLPHLDAASRSLKESETRALVVFSGLPVPEVNVDLVFEGERIGIVDLLIRCVMLVLEYEGRQHAESIKQFNRDIHRYAAFRRNLVDYLQITNEMLERPKALIQRIHARMVELGYDGPAPVFAGRWNSLFTTITATGSGAPASRSTRAVDASAPRRGRAGR